MNVRSNLRVDRCTLPLGAERGGPKSETSVTGSLSVDLSLRDFLDYIRENKVEVEMWLESKSDVVNVDPEVLLSALDITHAAIDEARGVVVVDLRAEDWERKDDEDEGADEDWDDAA